MTNTETAVTVARTSVPIEIDLTDWPAERFNRLIPTETIQMPSDFFVPAFTIVKLDPADRDGKSPDHYKSSDVPPGHRALTARALNKVATAASLSFFDERRTDDGSDRDVMGVTVMAAMTLPTGQRVSAPGSQVIDLRTWFGSQTSAAELGKFRKQFYAHVSTRAKNRAIRGILSLRASYPDADIAKPFLVVSFAPNMNHPVIQQAYAQALVPALEAAYGPDRGRPKQLVAGPAETVLPEAPETPTVLPGESLAAAGGSTEDVPDWAKPTTAAAAEAPKKASKPKTFVERLQESAEVSGMTGEANDAQKGKLRELISGLDWPTEIIPVLVAAFGDEAARILSAPQAQAILNVADALEAADPPVVLADAWRESAEAVRKAAAA